MTSYSPFDNPAFPNFDSETLIRFDQLRMRKSAQIVFDLLGYDNVRIVAGAVRDCILGRPITDIDMATTYGASDVMSLAKNADIRAIPTGLQHGTVTLICDEEHVEITTLREDVETDGRHATVAFTTNWALDAQRRDFTINALSLDAKGNIFDYTGGLDDLKSKRLRFIGNANARITEDYLRILRFYRFMSQIGFTQDQSALDATSRHLKGISQLSRERIYAEFKKMFAGTYCIQSLNQMRRHGVLLASMPCVPQQGYLSKFLDQRDNFQNILEEDFNIACFALLWLSNQNNISGLRDKLRLANAETKSLSHMVNADILPSFSGLNDQTWQRAAYRFGKKALILRLLFLGMRNQIDLGSEDIFTAMNKIKDWNPPSRPFGAQDLLSLGYKPGKELGLELKRLENLWIEQGFPSEFKLQLET